MTSDVMSYLFIIGCVLIILSNAQFNRALTQKVEGFGLIW